VEHRFYGDSIPNGNVNTPTPSPNLDNSGKTAQPKVAAKCAEWVDGSKTKEEAECTGLGNIYQCVTISSPEGNTSKCDDGQMCNGIGVDFYQIENGKCGYLSGEGEWKGFMARRIYCDTTNPPNGLIPEGTDCPLLVKDFGKTENNGAVAQSTIGLSALIALLLALLQE